MKRKMEGMIPLEILIPFINCPSLVCYGNEMIKLHGVYCVSQMGTDTKLSLIMCIIY